MASVTYRRSDDSGAAELETHRRERLREGVTMALYVGLSLLAVMVALPSDAGPSASDSPAALLFLTALGLLIAHWLAFRISARLAHRGRLASEHLELLAAQLAGGLAATAVAVLPVLLLGTPTGILVAELLLIGFVALVAYAAARTVPLDRIRAGGYVAAVVVLSLVVLSVKNLAGH